MAVVTEPIILDETGQDIVTQLQAIVAGLAPNAGQISYSNATSGLSADDVQEALDEIDGNVDTLSNSLTQLVKVVSFPASASKTISANGALNLTANDLNISAPSGYGAIGIVALYANSNDVTFRSVNAQATGTSSFCVARNVSNSSVTLTFSCTLLYIKSSFA